VTGIPGVGEGAPPRKIGLALGSGAARGWAHIGVINALSEVGIRPDCVAGTSIGALVGAAYASGKIRSLEELARGLDWRKVVSFFDVVFPRSGLIDGRKIADSVREHVEPGNIEDLPLPFRAVSTDLVTSGEVVIKDGDVVEAVRASISVPGMFTPVRRGAMILVDGGLVNPVPVSVARRMGADYVIAVDLTHDLPGQGSAKRVVPVDSDGAPPGEEATSRSVGKGVLPAGIGERIKSIDALGLAQLRQWMAKESMPNIFEVLMASTNVMEKQIAELQLRAEPPDLLIRPRLGHLRFMDFHTADEAILEGYRAAKSCLEEIGDAAAPF
jgi:NTE family protein